MPNYYNPYNFYPASYQNGYSGGLYPMQQPFQMSQQQQSYAQSPMKAMEWVEGEVGAKAFNMPTGWPANQPIPLWDSTDTVIWLKSWGPMGIPNPMQKLIYELPQQNQMLISGNDGTSQNTNKADSSQFVTKEDLNQLKQEIMRSLNQNGRQIRENRGEQNAKPTV